MIRYARARSIYDQFLIQGNLLTHKMRSQEFLQSYLQAAFRKCYGRKTIYFNLGHMLSDVL